MGQLLGSSTLDAVSPEQRTKKQDGPSPCEATLTGPNSLATSSDNIALNCSDHSMDVNPPDWHNLKDEGSDSGEDDSRYMEPNGHLSKSSSVNSLNAFEQPRDLKKNHKDENNGFVSRDLNDDTSISSNDSFDEVNEPSPAFDEKDEIWDPPESENEEDNQVNNMVTLDDDDDDECADGNGTEWANPSSPNGFEEEVSSSYRFKEERLKAMEEVMNGKFKNLVSQLLKKIGIVNCGKKEESWVDIVTLLAWQAASFVKPDSVEGKAMDPAGCVKIKCIATGSRKESQLIKGLVFKKHAAHKHMAINHKNPKVLLIQGVLGQSSDPYGLSSFNSMISEDKEKVAHLLENLKGCHPNVILVEKTASRYLLEEVLQMGVILVLDMKLHRLERVSCCTGSPIFSGITFNQKLRQCDSLYFEKFVEEHAVVGEGGKKPCKTLMFLEGCPTRLGCTILLKGSHSEELKKIKCVVQCAVVMAYHFILETSFLVDQKAMFSTIAFGRKADTSSTNGHSTSVVSETPNLPQSGEPNVGDVGSSDVEKSTHVKETMAKATEISTSFGFHDEPHVTTLPPSISDALEKVSMISPATYQHMSTYIDLNERKPEAQTPDRHDIEAKGSSIKDKPLHNDSQPLSADGEAGKAVDDFEDCFQTKDEISSVLDSESILVLMSSRNALRGTICEQSHFSHIKFYKNFDVPLGKFLRDNLFNQSLKCKACEGLPEAHFYYYAHHNKQLTIRVKRLGDKRKLPGESERKLWMWSRCGKCEPDKDKATKKVLISTPARGLSFGKFLELSFSSKSSFNKLSSCGHSFQKDFLYLFGLGSMVAMFRYSRVATYTVSLPAEKLEFNSSINRDWLQLEIEKVYTKGLLLFSEVANYLKTIESRFPGSKKVLNSSLKDLTDIVETLKLERSDFEENIKSIGAKNENSHNSGYKVLSLNRLRWEILLEACVWDRRLQLLLSSSSTSPRTISANVAEQRKEGLQENSNVEGKAQGSQEQMGEKDHSDKIVECQTGLKGPSAREVEEIQKAQEIISHGDHNTSKYSNDGDVRIPCEGVVQGCGEQDSISLLVIEENISRPRLEDSSPSVSLTQEPS